MTVSVNEDSLLKMHFDLQQDKVGWPPVAGESVWVKRLGDNLFQVENVPFFVMLIAYKDQVEGDFDGSVIQFRRHVKSSGYATIRVIFKTLEKQLELVRQLEEIRCEVEGSPQYKLLAIGIPPGNSFKQAMDIIRGGYEKKWWEYEEACLPPKPRKGLWDLFKKP